MKKYILLVSFIFIGFLSYAVSAQPKSTDYPVSIYSGKTAQKPDLSDPFTKNYQSQLTRALKNSADFAGEYTKASWGCGSSGCTVTAFINIRTGIALPQIFMAYSSDDDETIGEEITYADKSSRLLISYETSEELHQGKRQHFQNYYLLTDNILKLIHRIPAK